MPPENLQYYFVLAGHFGGSALSTAQELRSIIQQVHAWLDDSSTADHDIPQVDEHHLAPTPPERDFARRYNVEWQRSIHNFAEHMVTAHGPLVLVASGLLDHMVDNPHPFDQIMNQLGGEVIVYGHWEDVAPLHAPQGVIRVTCDVPNPVLARKATEELTGLSYIDPDAVIIATNRMSLTARPVADIKQVLEEIETILSSYDCTDIDYRLRTSNAREQL
ncbi:MAG: hypothetical protein GYB68_08180 [Chloroflexi bacterium]|nr:hypothetical protein [Chloroflexota bacterium]